MKPSSALFLQVLLLLSLSGGPTTPRLQAADSATARRLFAHPTRDYSTGPLWVWNDRLTKEQIVQTMTDLAGQHVKQVFVHPRPGLMTPYLSSEWFDLWQLALATAKRLDMNVWIYDENSYPSGFAGGWVPEVMPESRGRGLVFREVRELPAWSNEWLGVYRLTADGAENLSAKVRAGEKFAPGRYLIAAVQLAGNSPWHGGRCYVDLMRPGVTEKFLELTLEPYRQRFGAEFGRRLPGVFTDEPNIRPAGGLPWTDGLPALFEQRWGYNLLDHLPSLHSPIGDWRRVRHNFFQVLNDQFIEHWSKPYHDYCARYGLEWTGHYWDHEWPNCDGVPDNMAMYGWHQRPAIDCLMNQYREDTHAQFGNARMVKELSSVANQLGRQRTLCEVYGAGGWDLRLEDMKRIADWLEVLGINTLDQHLSYVTLRGARKRDHPQSFSYHEPWWEAYHVSANYLDRLSAALSHGEQINRILVLEPTTTAWMYQGDGAKLKEIGDQFFRLVMALEAAQVEYDLASEDLIARHGSLDGQKSAGPGGDTASELRIGHRSYHTVIVPPMAENLNATTEKLLRRCTAALYLGGAERHRVDGQVGTGGDAATAPAIEPILRSLIEDLAQRSRAEGFGLQRAEGDHGILFHHRRQFRDGQLLFLVNSSLTSASAGLITSPLQGLEQWDLNTGNIEPYPFVSSAGGLTAKFELPPSGSLLLWLSEKPLRPAQPASESATIIAPAGPTQVRRLQPNVLTLDYVDITSGGETRTNLYFYQANQFAFRQNGMERNPWDSAVQFKDELISRKFAADSGFTATYHFTLEGAVPARLAIVVERPDLYAIACNGQRVEARRGDWWLDKAFGRIDLASVARTGENVVTLTAKPFTIYHELESAYLLGEFSLRPTGHGFVVQADAGLTLGPWNEQGHPFYSAGVGYRQTYELRRLAGRYAVHLPAWYGSVAKVTVNGKLAGYIAAPPWQCEVTTHLKSGVNSLEVAAIGTLKNTLGPHHGKPGLGSAWPGMFQHGPNPGPPPGADYSTVGYGLFVPFELTQAVRGAP